MGGLVVINKLMNMIKYFFCKRDFSLCFVYFRFLGLYLNSVVINILVLRELRIYL